MFLYSSIIYYFFFLLHLPVVPSFSYSFSTAAHATLWATSSGDALPPSLLGVLVLFQGAIVGFLIDLLRMLRQALCTLWKISHALFAGMIPPLEMTFRMRTWKPQGLHFTILERIR